MIQSLIENIRLVFVIFVFLGLFGLASCGQEPGVDMSADTDTATSTDTAAGVGMVTDTGTSTDTGTGSGSGSIGDAGTDAVPGIRLGDVEETSTEEDEEETSTEEDETDEDTDDTSKPTDPCDEDFLCIPESYCINSGGLIYSDMFCDNEDHICCEEVPGGAECPVPYFCISSNRCLVGQRMDAYRCYEGTTCCDIENAKCEENGGRCRGSTGEPGFNPCWANEYISETLFCEDTELTCCLRQTGLCEPDNGRCSTRGCSEGETPDPQFICDSQSAECCTPPPPCEEVGGTCREASSGGFFGSRDPCEDDEEQSDVYPCEGRLQCCMPAEDVREVDDK
jgi:hypothetical protein